MTHAIGSRYFMQTFFESHVKLRTCYEEVERYEGAHRLAFDWVVRMRPDVWFWAPMPLPHCRLRQDAVTFPAGVVGCSYAPCINDHIAYLPRRHAAPYFTIASDMRSCAGVRNLSLHWKNYNVWRLMGQSVPLAAPSFFLPYTLLRPCANASLESYYPECLRWSEAPPEKNAGLSFFNGTALPDLAKYRRARRPLRPVPPARRRHLPRVRRPRARRPPRELRRHRQGVPGEATASAATPAGREGHGEGSRWATARRADAAAAHGLSVLGARGALAVPAAGGRREPCDEPGVALPSVQRLRRAAAGRACRAAGTGARAGARVRLHLAEPAAGALGRPTVLGAASARWRVPRHQGAHSHAARRCVRAPARRLWSRGARLARGVGPFDRPALSRLVGPRRAGWPREARDDPQRDRWEHPRRPPGRRDARAAAPHR